MGARFNEECNALDSIRGLRMFVGSKDQGLTLGSEKPKAIAR